MSRGPPDREPARGGETPGQAAVDVLVREVERRRVRDGGDEPQQEARQDDRREADPGGDRTHARVRERGAVHGWSRNVEGHVAAIGSRRRALDSVAPLDELLLVGALVRHEELAVRALEALVAGGGAVDELARERLVAVGALDRVDRVGGGRLAHPTQRTRRLPERRPAVLVP